MAKTPDTGTRLDGERSHYRSTLASLAARIHADAGQLSEAVKDDDRSLADRYAERIEHGLSAFKAASATLASLDHIAGIPLRVKE
jgi:hypothetical protein